MSEELVMPRLSDTMEEGTIGRWVVAEGDSFKEGDVLAEIETDKATMDFQAYDDGTVLRILVGDGESAPLGAPIAIVGDAGESVPDAPPRAAPEKRSEPKPQPEAEASAQAQAPAPQAAPAAAGNGRAAGLRVTPIARRMAEEAGVDLQPYAGRGSGPEGRIVKVDVERILKGSGPVPTGAAAPTAAPAAPAPATAAPAPQQADEVRELTPMLKAVASRMGQSKSTVPHFYIESAFDMTRALDLRRELNGGLAEAGEKISVNDLILRACALALIQHPNAHRSYVEGRHVYHAHANVGIAVALDDGLIVPVVAAADTKSLRQISIEARDLAGRARSGGLKQHEIEGGTFTVSNLGMFDVANFEAIINPPEAGILAVGATVPTPVVVDGEIVARSIMRCTLSVDHRAGSGADGARLLQTVKRLLQAPALLLA